MTIQWKGEPDWKALDSALLILRQQPAVAIREFERLAELGSLLSMHYLGVTYCRGDVVPRDKERGLYWHKRAAEGGLVKSEYYLGLEYLGQRRYDDAMKFLLHAAEAEYSPALNALGNIYFRGLGVNREFNVAIDYWRRAISQGHLLAKRDKAIAMISGAYGQFRIFEGLGVYITSIVEIVFEMIRDNNSKKIL